MQKSWQIQLLGDISAFNSITFGIIELNWSSEQCNEHQLGSRWWIFWVQEVLVSAIVCWSLIFGQSVLVLRLVDQRYRYQLIHFLQINSPTYTNILCKPAVQILQKYIGMYLFLIECIYVEVPKWSKSALMYTTVMRFLSIEKSAVL